MLAPGQIFASRYRIRRCIAEGGMGAIFEAEHLGTERRVALKLLFPHIMTVGNAREKFELEAKISARVNSPHIVQVWDAAIDPESGSPFLVMELLEGETLARRVEAQGALPLEQALPFLEQVAAGLDAAHGYREPGGAHKPIVHRDLKPENLFLALAPGGAVSAKILDYGIAKVLDEGLQISQEVRGTPLFMAVEQITASSLSPQTDIWAYGLIAHHALTGVHYWRSAAREDAGVQAVFAEILALPLDAPSTRWRELGVRAPLPEAFDGWLLRCIDRDPARRFPGAGVAFQALLQALGRSAPSRSGEQSAAAGSRAAPPPASGAARAEPGGSSPSLVAGRGAASLGRAASTGSVPALSATQHRAAPRAALGLRLRLPWRWLAAAAGGGLIAASAVWAAGGSEPRHTLGGHASGSSAAPVEPAPLPLQPAPPPAGPPFTPAPEPPSPAAPHAPSEAPRVRVEPAPPRASPAFTPALEPPSPEAPHAPPEAPRVRVDPQPLAPPSVRVGPVSGAPERASTPPVAAPGSRPSSPARPVPRAAAAQRGRAERQAPVAGDAYEIR